jgi:hypothetical protein
MTSKSQTQEPLAADTKPESEPAAEVVGVLATTTTTTTSTSTSTTTADTTISKEDEGSLKRKASSGAATSTTDTEDCHSSASEDEGGSPKRPRSESVPLDLAPTLGLKVGDRIDVHWEIEKNNGETYAHWWGAELLEHDGRTTDEVAIRTIQYDAKPELGFSSCTDDVIFLGDDIIVSPDSQTQLHYRREGQEEVFWYNEGDLDAQLNSILMGALDKNRGAWKNLSPVQQAVIAEKIAGKKEKLKEALKSRNEVITSAIIKDVLQKAFE